MADIYVYSSNEDNNDYASFGMVGALIPTSATFTESGNGESTMTMEHPIDDFGRYTALVKGNILSVPVPVRTTPEIQNGSCVTTVWTYEVKPLAQLTSKKQRTLYKKKTGSGRMKYLNAGDIVTVVEKPENTGSSTSAERWKVKSKYGTGWIDPTGFTLKTTKTLDNNANAIQEVQSPWTITPQLFRIYEVQKKLDSIEVSARHITYDLLYNTTLYTSDSSVDTQTAINGILNNCVNKNHGFSAHTNVKNEQAGLNYRGDNPINAFLDPEDGICAKYKVDIIRDNYDLYFLHDPGMNRGVTISYGKNLTDITYTLSDDEVTTRIIPVGENKDGTPLYLSDTESERYVDSTRINEYPVIHTYYLKCDNCTVGQKDSTGSKITVAIARARMKAQAQAMYDDDHCDLPSVKMEVGFLNLGDTEEYAQFKNLENCFLYDYIIVRHPKQDVNVTAQIQSIEWDILNERMNGVSIGSVGVTLANSGITTWQIPSGFSGSKIGYGTIGSGALASDVISTRHLQAGSVNAEILEANSVNAMIVTAVQAKIHELVAGSITTDQLYVDLATIAAAQITTANIEKAEIKWADIESLSAEIAKIANAEIAKAEIDYAQIKNLDAAIASIAKAQITQAVIKGAQIEDASITTAKIALGAITSALIQNGAIGTAQIADGSITDAKIVSLNADVITAGTLSVERLLIKGPNGLFRAINATDDGLTVEQLSEEQYQNAISGTVLVARSVTADKIAAKSITANEILGNTITAAEINVANLFAAEATITALDSYILRTSTIEAIEGKLDIWAADKISLAINGRITPEGITIGSVIEMDDEHTKVSTKYFDVDVPGDAGDLHIDENGMSADTATFNTLNCDEVVKKYTGASTITLAANSDASVVGAALNNKCVTSNVAILLNGDINGLLDIRGTTGNGNITINGQGHTLNGHVWIVNNAKYITILNLKVSNSGDQRGSMHFHANRAIRISKCTCNGNSLSTSAGASQGLRVYHTSIQVENCEFYNMADFNMVFGSCADAYVIGCKGDGAKCVYTDGASVKWSGTRPSGSWGKGVPSLTAPADLTTLTIDTGSATPTETPVTTASFKANVTGTYYPSGHWINDNVIRQGHEGTGSSARRDYGCMWFAASSLKNKTIKSATLTIKRVAGKGRSSSVTMKLWTTTVTGKSGVMASSTLTSLGEIGKIANGETLTVSIPVSAIATIASGGGLVLYTEETTNKTGKTYSENYAHFEGTNGSAPVLTVTYQ